MLKSIKKTILVLGFVIVFSNLGLNFAYATDISGDFTDLNFKQAIWEWLGNPENSTPGSFTKQDLINRMPSKSYRLSVSDNNMVSMAGLEHFEGTGLEKLSCISTKLVVLSELPSSLKDLSISCSSLTQLPNLDHTSLEVFRSQTSKITVLPNLPASLVSLDLVYCFNLVQLPELKHTNLEKLLCPSSIKTIPEVPSTLKHLDTSSGLIELPELKHTQLEYLDCNGSKITFLPEVPSSLKELRLGRQQLGCQQLTQMSELKHTSLERFVCNVPKLVIMPELPTSLKELEIGGYRNELPVLKNTSLVYLDINNCGMTFLPELPECLEELHIGICTKITQLPELKNTHLEKIAILNSGITEIPELSPTMEELSCSLYTPVRSIHSIPPNMKRLSFSYTNLMSLPDLSNSSLTSLGVGNSLLTSIPEDFPDSLISVGFSHNYINVWEEPIKTQLANLGVTYLSYLPQFRIHTEQKIVLGLDGSMTLQPFNNQKSDDGVIWTNEFPTWGNFTDFILTSSDETIATIDENGIITSYKNEGFCTITAKYYGIDSEFTVVDIPVKVFYPLGMSLAQVPAPPEYGKNVDVNISFNKENEKIVVRKYALGEQNSDYFTTQGMDLATNNVTIAENGTYTFYAKDIFDSETLAVITIDNIDNTPPLLEVNHEQRGNNHVLVAIASDSQSGVKAIRLPNLQWVAVSEFVYPVVNEGSYIFKAEDKVGNLVESFEVVGFNYSVPNTPVNESNGLNYFDLNGKRIYLSKNKAVNVKLQDLPVGSTLIATIDGVQQSPGDKIINSALSKTITFENIGLQCVALKVISPTGVESNIYKEWYLINNIKPEVKLIAGGENVPLSTLLIGTRELHLWAESPIAHFDLEYSVDNGFSYLPLPNNGKINYNVTSGLNTIEIQVRDKVGNVTVKNMTLLGIQKGAF